MNTEFCLFDRSLSLSRWPANQKNRSLQAWDSADEYLISHVTEQALPTDALLLINDSFGALGCWFADDAPYSLTDSFVACQGTIHNAQNNALEVTPDRLLNSLDELPEHISLVLLKIPKNNGYLEYLLARIAQFLAPGTQVIAAGKTTDIHTSTLNLFERLIGPTTTSLAKKKSRLIFATLDNPPQPSRYPIRWPLEKSDLTIVNHANVFSRDSLDIGARLLLQNLPADTDGKTVVDLGCGNGVIGTTLLKTNPKTRVSFFDESYMAVASAKATVEENLPDSLKQCRFVVDDCLTSQLDSSVDIVICNPPFHQQQAVTDHIAWQMFNDVRRVLKPGGRLIVVGNRNLAYHVKLKRLFGGCKTLDANKKFTVLISQKG